MPFKFEKLEIWQLSKDLIVEIYDLSDSIPVHEKYNLRSQLRRAVVSVNLNIAEGSTGQSNAEQARFLRYANRSLMETVSCLIILKDLQYIIDIHDIYLSCEKLSAKISSMIIFLNK